jgi:putative tricarboxylic transport membrane protein
MLLPITFGLPPVGALIMLAGIYYGAQYGGSTTSVLVNIPGEATSVITCLDGHQMARQGRAGAALSIAAIGSFFAGCVSTVLVAALGVPLTSIALLFGPAEYFSLMLLGLIFAVVLAKGSVLKSIAMVVTGLLLSMVGSDLETGAGRHATSSEVQVRSTSSREMNVAQRSTSDLPLAFAACNRAQRCYGK